MCIYLGLLESFQDETVFWGSADFEDVYPISLAVGLDSCFSQFVPDRLPFLSCVIVSDANFRKYIGRIF